MFNLTTLDYIYIGVILASTIWATIRGGVYETVATISWIIAILAARFLSPFIDVWLQKLFGLPESTLGTYLTSYALVVVLILIAFSFFNQKLRDKVQESLLKVTDHTLGVVFGVIRGIAIMGLLYWGALGIYQGRDLPNYVSAARLRPVMRSTAELIHNWFIPVTGRWGAVLARDVASAASSQEIFDNLTSPKIATPATAADSGGATATTPDAPKITTNTDTGYKPSEREALENQLMQIESVADADAARAAARAQRADAAAAAAAANAANPTSAPTQTGQNPSK